MKEEEEMRSRFLSRDQSENHTECLNCHEEFDAAEALPFKGSPDAYACVDICPDCQAAPGDIDIGVIARSLMVREWLQSDIDTVAATIRRLQRKAFPVTSPRAA